jgi:hypothetical protein
MADHRERALERRTRSELLREAFRQYVERHRRWDQLFEVGEEVARARGLDEAASTTFGGVRCPRFGHFTEKRCASRGSR